MKRILVVVGTRPEAIKMVPVVKALRNSERLRVTVAVTGQHRHMLDQVFSVFDEKPDLDLDLMKRNQTLSDLTAHILQSMSRVLAENQPDMILVHGDTTSAAATAIAAFYARCPVGHVEAGLRTNDLQSPWPEEFNRVVIDTVADYLFAPTEAARTNLLKEYNRKGRIFVTGNTGIDSLLFMSRLIDNNQAMRSKLAARYGFLDPSRKLILVTAHRRESFGDGLQRICDGIEAIAERRDIELLYPVHLNPKVHGVVHERLRHHTNVHLCEPVEYLDMVYLMKSAALIITDSGGIQEEAPALGKPVLVIRDVTERPEGLVTGAVKLVGTDPRKLRDEVDLLLDDERHYRLVARPVFPYGDGTAAAKIVKHIEDDFR